MEEKCSKNALEECREVTCPHHIFNDIGNWEIVWNSPAKEFGYCVKNISREYSFEEIGQCFGFTKQWTERICFRAMRAYYGNAWREPDMESILRRFNGVGQRMYVVKGKGETNKPKTFKKLNWNFSQKLRRSERRVE